VSRQLILVRHGQTLHNVAGIAQGWNDSALSDHGRKQVLRLAERILEYAPNALYSSPLGRAMSTAQAIADATRLPILPLEDFREMNYGGWEGRSFLDVRREHEDIYQRWINDGEAACPNGESHMDVRRRIERALQSIDDERAVIVTHGTAIRIAATALLELPVMASRHFAQDNAAINVFHWRADRWVLKVWNHS
jgi:broad specificity phosphatase PhoE